MSGSLSCQGSAVFRGWCVKLLLEEDDGTEIIVLYLEGTSDGRRLMKLAGRIRDSKPIIVLKSGRTREGSRAVSSHTGSLAGSDMAYTAAFRQCGVLRVEGLGELFDLLECLTSQPLPKGNRVGVITNAGGLGILQADACVKEGLKLPEFSQSTIDSLRSHLPSGASLYNPVDVLGDSGAEEYARATSSVMADEGVDSVVCLTSPQAMTGARATTTPSTKSRPASGTGSAMVPLYSTGPPRCPMPPMP